jgi:hypothetical protein
LEPFALPSGPYIFHDFFFPFSLLFHLFPFLRPSTTIITKVTEEKEKGPVEYNVSDVSPTIKNLGNDALYIAIQL